MSVRNRPGACWTSVLMATPWSRRFPPYTPELTEGPAVYRPRATTLPGAAIAGAVADALGARVPGTSKAADDSPTGLGFGGALAGLGQQGGKDRKTKDGSYRISKVARAPSVTTAR